MAGEKKSGEERQVVVFNIGSEEFGVDIGEVREIIKMEQITQIPNTPEYVKGVINLRGGIIVVVDLSMKMGIRSTGQSKDTRIIVIETTDTTVGMIVDSCNEVMRLIESQIKSAPAAITKKIDADYIDGVGIVGDRLIILLDLAKVLAIREVETVRSVQTSLA